MNKVEKAKGGLNLITNAAQRLLDPANKENKADLLLGSFVFEDSPQGRNYWWNRYKELNNGKPLSKTAMRHITRMINVEKRRVKI